MVSGPILGELGITSTYERGLFDVATDWTTRSQATKQQHAEGPVSITILGDLSADPS